jgi:hypothetical protein
MAFSNGPTIVTNGLVFSLDASDRNSYTIGNGTELVTNPNLLNPNDGQTATVSRTASNNTIITGLGTMTSGSYYILNYIVTENTGSMSSTFRIGGSAGNTSPSLIRISGGVTGSYSIIFQALVTSTLTLNGDDVNTYMVLDYISVQQLSNTWNDLSGNNINGTLTNGPVFNFTKGGGINFNGTNQHITFPGNTFNYSPGTTGEITLEMWVTPNGPFTPYGSEPPTTNLGGFIGQGYYASTIGWGLGALVVNSGSYFFNFQVRNNATIVSITGSFTTGSQYHVVGSFTRNDLSRLYVNNVLVASASSTSLNGLSLTPSVANAAIGRAGAAGNFYSGFNINKTAIYNRALSAAEVSQNYNALKTRFNLP